MKDRSGSEIRALAFPNQPHTSPAAYSYCQFEQFPPPEILMNSWIPVVSAEQMAKTEYDVLIVGSGSGGSAALWRICQQFAGSGKRVGMIERGNLLLPSHAVNLPTVGSKRLPSLYLNPNITDLVGKRLPQFRGAKLVYALGGRTLFWGAVSPRIPDYVLAGWPVSIPEMHYYYGIAEQLLHVTRQYGAESTFNQAVLNRLRALGFPETEMLPIAADLKATQYGEIHSDVYFSANQLFARAMNLHPFDLAVNTRAVKILFQGGRPAGVSVITSDKKVLEIKSKTIVLSASALETPRILMNSGVGGPALGHYLTNHSIVTTNGLLNSEGIPEILGTVNLLVPQRPGRPFQVQVQGPYFSYSFTDVKPRAEAWRLGFFGSIGHVQSRYDNFVSLSSRMDEDGVPQIQVQFSYSRKDIDVIEASRMTMESIARIIGLQPETGNGLDYCVYEPGGDAHESATCRMGLDPAVSVTNPYGQVHGIPGLYVADNSVIPDMGASNPVLSIIALAIRTADDIAKKLR